MPKQPTPKGPVSKGSPLDAAQRQVRGLYGRASTTASKNATSAKQVAAKRPVRGMGSIGPEFGSRPQRPVTRGGGSKAGDMRKAAATEGKSAAKGAKATIDMKKKLARVDYDALGKLMKSKAKLPKTK